MNLNTNRIKLWMTAAIAVAGGLSAFAQTNAFKPFEMISQRNIFDPNRLPPRNFTNRQSAPVYSFSLVGTMSYEKGMFAVFDGTSSDYHKVLESGGRIANYTVGTITHDSVKLSSGTNLVDLKVGMQMRRNTDGSWTMAAFSGENSFASRFRNNNGNNNNRFDRNDRGNFDRGNFDRGNLDRGNFSRNGGNNQRSFGGQNNYRTGYQSPYGRNESNMEQSGGGGQVQTGPGASGSSDPNDVVARMMAARRAQMGNSGDQNDGQNQNDNQGMPDNTGQPVDQNQNQQIDQNGNPMQNMGGNPAQNMGGNPVENQNIPNANQGGGDQPGNQTGNENVPDNSTPRL
jgi:hypothetical protein